MEKKSFSTLLEDYMWNNRMNCTELAKKIGVSQPAVNRWISGKREPRLRQLLKVLDATDIKIEQISRDQAARGKE